MKCAAFASAFVAVSAKCEFHLTFGAACPECQKFGPTLRDVYAADGIADACSFELTPCIRTAGDPETDTAYDCAGEETGCPVTAWLLCAFDGAQDTTQKVEFLSCWDDSHGQDARSCASAAGIDYAGMSECVNGTRVVDLKKGAAIDFEAKFPDRAHSGEYHGFQPVINGQEPNETLAYDAVIEEICATGISAGICGPAFLV